MATLLESLVAAGQLRFGLLGGGGPGGAPGRGNGAVAQWVQAHGTPVDPAAYGGGGTPQLYDLRGT